ncbi:hypothetical protein ACQ4N7_12440 [Nodosilinea sp. AN01ver1]
MHNAAIFLEVGANSLAREGAVEFELAWAGDRNGLSASLSYALQPADCVVK